MAAIGSGAVVEPCRQPEQVPKAIAHAHTQEHRRQNHALLACLEDFLAYIRIKVFPSASHLMTIKVTNGVVRWFRSDVVALALGCRDSQRVPRVMTCRYQSDNEHHNEYDHARKSPEIAKSILTEVVPESCQCAQVRDTREPGKLDKPLPVVCRNTSVQLREATDENRKSGNELEIAHRKHGLARLAAWTGLWSMGMYMCKRVLYAQALLTPSFNTTRLSLSTEPPV